MTIGDNISNLAKKKNMTMYRLSKNSKVSSSYLSTLVNNINTNPSLDILKRICKALNVTLDELERG